MYPENDNLYEETIIKEVFTHENSFTIIYPSGVGFSFPAIGIVPKVGDKVRAYPSIRWGDRVSKLFVNDQLAYSKN